MIAQTIQLALAPVFVLVAIGHIMSILSQRLGRTVDRARTLQDKHGQTSGDEHARVVAEMRSIDRRIALITRGIRMLVMGGISIGTTVAVLFLEEVLGYSLDTVAAAFFIVAIAMLMWGLTMFLREIQLAAATLRIRRDLLEWDD